MKLLNVLASVLLMSTVSMASQQAADAMPGKLKVETEETVIDKGAGTVTKYRNDKLKVVGAPASKNKRDDDSWIKHKEQTLTVRPGMYGNMKKDEIENSKAEQDNLQKESDKSRIDEQARKAQAWRTDEDKKVLGKFDSKSGVADKSGVNALKNKFNAPKQESDADKLKRIKEANMAAAKARREAILAKKNPPAAG